MTRSLFVAEVGDKLIAAALVINPADQFSTAAVLERLSVDDTIPSADEQGWICVAIDPTEPKQFAVESLQVIGEVHLTHTDRSEVAKYLGLATARALLDREPGAFDDELPG